MTKDKKEFEVIRQNWLESERGWGQRPDGYSIHLSLGDLRKYVEEYWASMPDEVPDDYSAPDPFSPPKEHFVDKETYDKLMLAKKKGRFGIRKL